MLRKKGVLAMLAIVAFLAILPACDSLNQKSESPVGPTSLADNPSQKDKPDDKPQTAYSCNYVDRIVYECLYSLRPYCSSNPYKSINGNAVSEWNYLYSNVSVYQVVKGYYGNPNSSLWSSFYNDLSSYGCSGGYGRGGQCPYYANTIFYRSGVFPKQFPSYATCRADYYGSQRFTKSVSRVRRDCDSWRRRRQFGLPSRRR
jgi:hypothetical protein